MWDGGARREANMEMEGHQRPEPEVCLACHCHMYPGEPGTYLIGTIPGTYRTYMNRYLGRRDSNHPLYTV